MLSPRYRQLGSGYFQQKKRKKEKEVVDNKPALGEVSVFADTHRQLSVLTIR